MPHADRTYQCTYHPLDRDGLPVAFETGTLPYLVLTAPDAESAQRQAFDRCKAPIVGVERIEPQPAAPRRAPRNEREAHMTLADGRALDLRTPWVLPGVPA